MANVLTNPGFEAGDLTGWNHTYSIFGVTVWAYGTSYSLYLKRRPTDGTEKVYWCSQAGTSGAEEPNWSLAPNLGDTLEDGTAVWTCGGNMATDYTIDEIVYAPGSTKSLKIQHGVERLYQNFTPTVGKRYKVYLHVKMASAWEPSWGLNYVSSLIKASISVTNSTPALSRSDVLWTRDAYIHSTDWNLYYVGDYVPIDGDTAAQLNIVFSLYDESTIWIDNVVVDELDVGYYGSYNRPTVLFNKDEDFNCWFESQQAHILSTDTVPAGDVPPSPKISLKCMPGESCRFQVVVNPAIEWTPVTWSWDSFSGIGDITEVKKVQYVTIRTAPAWNPLQPTGSIPDPLPEEASSTLAAESVNPYFFIIRVPRATALGTYNANLYLKLDGVTQCTIPVELTVDGVALPTEPSFRLLCPIQESRADDFETVDAAFRLRYCTFFLRDRGIYRTMPDINLITWNDGDLILDTTALDPLWALYVSYGMRPYVPFYALKITSNNDYGMLNVAGHVISIFTDDTYTMLTDDFKTTFQTLLEKILIQIQAQGHTRNDFEVKLADEPGLANVAVRNFQTYVANYIHAVNPKIYVTCAGPWVIQDWLSSHNLWTWTQYQTGSWAGEVAASKRYNNAGGYHIYWGNRLSAPIIYRLLLWALWQDGYRGWEWNQLNSGTTDTNIWTTDTGIDGPHLLYPPRGAPYETEGPVSSLRWEAQAQGLCDVELFEWLRLLISLRTNVASAGDLATAQAALDRVAEVVTHAPQIFGTVAATTGDQFTTDRFCSFDLEVIDSIRSDVIDAIVLLDAYHTPEAQVGGVGNVGSVLGVTNIGSVNGVVS